MRALMTTRERISLGFLWKNLHCVPTSYAKTRLDPYDVAVTKSDRP
jgi:hypothetical protein